MAKLYIDMKPNKKLVQIIDDALDALAFDAAEAMMKQGETDPNIFLFLIHQFAIQFTIKFLTEVQNRSFEFAKKIVQMSNKEQ